MKQENAMNDLLSEMASDSREAPDKLDTLDTNKLDGVSRLAAEAANLEKEISDGEQLLKDKKKALYKITDEQLPEVLEEMGLQKFTLTDGAEISVKPLYAASIPRDRKSEAFQWLRDHEFGDLVKNNVTVTFGRGEDDTAKEFVGLCGSQGFTPSQLEKVEPMTLKAWLRERVEAGDPIPLDLFGAFITQRATIKRSK
tara:strand:- start:441 stop:1034 length:594 start_codon:yes stop_codon:yes gene_type:complete